MADYFEEVRALTAEVLKVDAQEIKPETRFIEDLKADSMDQFFLIDGLSEKFGLTIPDEDARQIKSIQDAVNYIAQHKA